MPEKCVSVHNYRVVIPETLYRWLKKHDIYSLLLLYMNICHVFKDVGKRIKLKVGIT